MIFLATLNRSIDLHQTSGHCIGSFAFPIKCSAAVRSFTVVKLTRPYGNRLTIALESRKEGGSLRAITSSHS